MNTALSSNKIVQIGSRRYTIAKNFAAITGNSPAWITQNKPSLPIEPCEALGVDLIDITAYEMMDSANALKFSSLTLEKDLYGYNYYELGLIFANLIKNLTEGKSNADLALKEKIEEVALLKNLHEQSQKDLKNALDRENVLRDDKLALIEQTAELAALVSGLNEDKSKLENVVLEKTAKIGELETDLEKAHQELAQTQILLTDTKHDNDLKVVEIKALQTEKAGLEKTLHEKEALFLEKTEMCKGLTEQVGFLESDLAQAKNTALYAQNAEKMAIAEKEPLKVRIEALEKEVLTAKDLAQKEWNRLEKLLSGESVFSEPFELWLEKTSEEREGCRILAKTMLGFTTSEGKLVKPEGGLVSVPAWQLVFLLQEQNDLPTEKPAKQKGGAK